MEQDILVRRKHIIKVTAIIVSCLLVLFSVLYTITAKRSFLRKVETVNLGYGFKRADNPKADSTIFTDSSYISLSRRKAWMQAKTVMADNDSVSLSISIPDSSAVLEINGVTVYKAKIAGFAISRLFIRADEYAITNMLSRPFNIVSDISTIEKEPLSHKVAPKDTSEYIPAEIPDTTRNEAVNYVFETDNGFRIYIFQQREGQLKRDASGFFFDVRQRIRNATTIAKGAVTFKSPDYYPYIKIIIPRKDARIIYRALPRKGQIAFRR